MRIIYICGYGTTAVGGVQTVVPEYIRNISKVMQVSVLSLGGKAFEACDMISDEKELFHNLGAIDLVIFHEVYYIKFFHIAKKLYARNIPYIVIPHCSLTNGAQIQKKYIKKIFNILWVDKFVRHAAAVQFLTENECRNSSKFITKPIIIPNGIKIDDNKAPKLYNEGCNGMRLIYVGRLSVFQKGLDILIDACFKISEFMEEHDIILDIYGTDFECGRKKIESQIKDFNLEHLVHIYDGVFGKEKEQVLLEHDVFVHTSRFEGQPMGILEAMEYVMPVIVTPGTTFADDVQKYDCGWCVQENADSVADGIKKSYYEKKMWQVKGTNALKLLKENYSWDVVAKLTAQKYQEVINF
jgi:glycosyltransferase involved in cell wall biosynthesis